MPIYRYTPYDYAFVRALLAHKLRPTTVARTTRMNVNTVRAIRDGKIKGEVPAAADILAAAKAAAEAIKKAEKTAVQAYVKTLRDMANRVAKSGVIV